MRYIDHNKLNGQRLRAIVWRLNKLLISARIAHERGAVLYDQGQFHGAKMRNPDDLVMYLEDARREAKEYLRNG